LVPSCCHTKRTFKVWSTSKPSSKATQKVFQSVSSYNTQADTFLFHIMKFGLF
jgi:hypothetical protein